MSRLELVVSIEIAGIELQQQTAQLLLHIRVLRILLEFFQGQEELDLGVIVVALETQSVGGIQFDLDGVARQGQVVGIAALVIGIEVVEIPLFLLRRRAGGQCRRQQHEQRDQNQGRRVPMFLHKSHLVLRATIS